MLYRPFLDANVLNFCYFPKRRKKWHFLDFFETPLASRGRQGTITIVPPYDDFGDWATPKEPAAELFFPFSIPSNHFLFILLPEFPFRDDLPFAKLRG